MRKYLLTIVFRPDLDKTELMGEINTVLTDLDSKIESEEELPVKKLAYEIKKSREGNIVLYHLLGSTELPHRLTEILRISDEVLRFMITSEPEVKKTKAEVTAPEITQEVKSVSKSKVKNAA